RALNILIHAGRAVVGVDGRLRIKAMRVQAKGGGAVNPIPVDALLTSAGWTPSVHLFSQSRGKVVFDEAGQRFLPGVAVQDCVSVGACGGTDDLDDLLAQASKAGHEAALQAGASGGSSRQFKASGSEIWSGGMIGAGPGAGADSKSKAFVDFQNDVTAKDI